MQRLHCGLMIPLARCHFRWQLIAPPCEAHSRRRAGLWIPIRRSRVMSPATCPPRALSSLLWAYDPCRQIS